MSEKESVRFACEFCGEDVFQGYCKCKQSMDAMRHLANIFESFKVCDNIMKELDGRGDLSEDEVERIIKMCEEEKKRMKIELITLLGEVDE